MITLKFRTPVFVIQSSYDFGSVPILFNDNTKISTPVFVIQSSYDFGTKPILFNDNTKIQNSCICDTIKLRHWHEANFI